MDVLVGAPAAICCMFAAVLAQSVRFGSGRYTYPTHQDMYENLHLQLYGTKKITLFAPSDSTKMYVSHLLSLSLPPFPLFPRRMARYVHGLPLIVNAIMNGPHWIFPLTCDPYWSSRM